MRKNTLVISQQVSACSRGSNPFLGKLGKKLNKIELLYYNENYYNKFNGG